MILYRTALCRQPETTDSVCSMQFKLYRTALCRQPETVVPPYWQKKYYIERLSVGNLKQMYLLYTFQLDYIERLSVGNLKLEDTCGELFTIISNGSL